MNCPGRADLAITVSGFTAGPQVVCSKEAGHQGPCLSVLKKVTVKGPLGAIPVQLSAEWFCGYGAPPAPEAAPPTTDPPPRPGA